MAREKRARGERPGDLRQEVNRVRTSRNHLKDICRDRTAMNKQLRDRNVELTENRDKWKTRSKELEQQLKTAQEEVERERERADQERERADTLQAEVEMVWEKKSRARRFDPSDRKERTS
jgi:hypothetical protein